MGDDSRANVIAVAEAAFLTLTEPRGVARGYGGHDHVPQGVHGGPPFLLRSGREGLGRGVRGVSGAFRPRGHSDSDLLLLLDAGEVDNVVLVVVEPGGRVVFVGSRLAPF